MKYSILLSIIISTLFADYYYCYYPEIKAFNDQYITSSTAIYKKRNDHYEKVYLFDKKIKYASFDNNKLITDIGSFIIDQYKIIAKGVENSQLIKNNIVLNKFMVQENVDSILLIKDFDLDGTEEIIYKHGDIKIGQLKNNIIKDHPSKKVVLKDTDGDNRNELVINVNGNKYIYCINGLKLLQYENMKKYSEKELILKTPDELELLRYFIYAKHGKVFNNQKIREYFNNQSWYKPDPKYSEEMLSKTEKDNAMLIYNIESQKRREGLRDFNVKLPN